MLTVGQNEVPLTDVAQVVYSNQQAQIQRIDGDYVVTVTGQTASGVSASQLSQQLIAQAQGMNLDGITVSQGSNMRRMESEFGAIGNALATSIFLVFVVMAFQFESCRFSLVVMLSVPFSMTGAFLALSVTCMSISNRADYAGRDCSKQCHRIDRLYVLSAQNPGNVPYGRFDCIREKPSAPYPDDHINNNFIFDSYGRWHWRKG